MSINNSEDLNRYYNIINNLVDNYVESNKIKPSNLLNYLKPGSDRFNRFLIRNGLNEVKGSDIILKDILIDRAGMEEDGVYTFESYKYYESVEFKISNLKQCLYKGIEKSDIKSEKIIADYFDVNLGDIDVVDSEKHTFKVNDWNGDDWVVFIYSEEDFDIIKSNIKEYLFDELSSSSVDLVGEVKLELNDLIDKETYNKKLEDKLTSDFLTKLIEKILGESVKYLDVVKDYHLWSK